MRSLLALLVLVFAAPAFAHAAGIPNFGVIIPQQIDLCAANWAGLITVVNNLITFAITMLIVFVAPLAFAYAGFLYVLNPVNAEGKTQARKVMMNVVIGIVVSLAGWLIVDAVMAVLYNPNASSGTTTLGTWYSIINGNAGALCLIQAGSLGNFNQVPTASGVQTTGVGANGGQYLTLPTSGQCTPGNIHYAASQGQYNLTEAQADVLSCVATPESGCNNTPPTAHQSDGTPTTAAGVFQITYGAGTDNCHQLNLSVCTQAAAAVGWTGGNLNCSSVFTCSNGNATCVAKPGKEANANACNAAAANFNCNASAAACLIQSQGPNAWTADSRASTQANCVSQYAGS